MGSGSGSQRSADVLEGAFPEQWAFIGDPAKLKWADVVARKKR